MGMHLGRLGALLAFSVTTIGAGIAMPQGQAVYGWILIVIGVTTLIVTLWAWTYYHWSDIKLWARRVGAAQITLLVGVLGTWLFMTTALGAVAWMLVTGQSVSGITRSSNDDGPLAWTTSMEMLGGATVPVKWIVFRGKNISGREIKLKAANIVSAINGTEQKLDAALAQDGDVPLGDLNLVPPGAPISLIARFNPPNGLPAKEFLETWSRFYLNVEDNERSYRVQFNENYLAPFFPGLVGPRLTKKQSN